MTWSVADMATVKSVAQQYGVKTGTDENGRTYYIFPVSGKRMAPIRVCLATRS